MDIDFSPITELLSHKSLASTKRHIFILSGDGEWQIVSLKKILSNHESDALWVGNDSQELFPFIETKKSRSWLGSEKRIVIFDANNDFDSDSFAAISGIVIGGGLFFLLLPPKDKWNSIYSSYFGQRLLQSIYNNANILVVNQADKQQVIRLNKTKTAPEKLSSSTPPFLTNDQQKSVESIETQLLNETKTPIVLISDRGRGKSAALGIAIARVIQSGIKNIAITAPRLSATSIIFKHIAEMLPDAEISKGSVKFAESNVQFYSPDNLIQDKIKADILFVDEAAAIPVPLLKEFLTNYQQCVFATTVHGYEGTGRGFSLRFFKELDKHDSTWLKLQMQTPIRWAKNDPLENWMFDLLCLDSEILENELVSQVDTDELEYCLINKDELISRDYLLKEVFSLLVLAHYRTRPKDLKSLLDDKNIFLYVVLYQEHVIAVSLVSQEGLFSKELSTDVYKGKRRPPGHLLAQTLTYHCGIEQASTLDYSRVMRIAVHPNLQHQGIGTKLLTFIINNEKNNGRDAIGTSFGMNKSLLEFWGKSKFETVRIGFTREQTSGENAAIMLLALSTKGNAIYKEAVSKFNGQLPYWLADVLIDLPNELKLYFKSITKKSTKLTSFDNDDLYSYINYSRNYELCIASLNKLVFMKRHEIKKIDFPDDFRQVLNKKIMDKMNWKSIGQEMGSRSQNEARKLFYNAILYLVRDQTIEKVMLNS